MEKVITSSIKARRTKLGKKTVNELVDIILRKDDVEKRKDVLIKCLKNNIVGLENKLIAETKQHSDDVNHYNDLVNEYDDKTRDDVEMLKEIRTKLEKTVFEKDKYLKQLQVTIAVIILLLFIIFSLAGVLMYLV